VKRWRLEPGLEIDGFRVGELIHRGGMADLWDVTRHGETLPLLMKVPALVEGEDPASIVGFEMEQMIMPRLKGPHVPRFIAAGDFSKHPYIVMERLAGPTLLPRLKELPLPVPELAALGARIADALESLHRQRIVHLDLKPSNVIFRPTGEAVMIDFGLSHHRDLPDLLHEEFRLPYGTAPYMAPEQVLGVRSDQRSDLFALGCLLYFFATGTRPFGDPQKLRGLKQRLWRDPVPPRKLRTDIPPWFQEIVLRCLETHAGRRHQSAAQLAMDLRNPSQIVLTPRADKRVQDSYFAVLRRKSEPEQSLIDRPPELPGSLADAPIVAVAVNLDDIGDDLSAALRRTVMRILERAPEARLACVNVLKLARLAMDTSLDAEGNSRHVQRLVGLKAWAHDLQLPSGGVSFHVLEAIDPAEAILDYARQNNVDHIVMGARANSAMRKLLGSVSGKVAAEAPCTVTVVRDRQPDEWPSPPSSPASSA
jgi:eukaryotic-like serine/threonine-protein kinase